MPFSIQLKKAMMSTEREVMN